MFGGSSNRRIWVVGLVASECVADLGYPATSAEELNNYFVSQIQSIIEKYPAGADGSPPAQAVDELSELADEENSIAPRVLACGENLTAARASLRVEFEQEFVDQYAQGIREQLSDIDLTQLTDFLPKKEN